MAESIGPIIEERVQSSVFKAPEVNVPLIKNFYGVPGLDDIFNVVTVAFTNLQFFFDKKAYWQSLVFLTEFAGLYAVIMVESLDRGIHFWSPNSKCRTLLAIHADSKLVLFSSCYYLR